MLRLGSRQPLVLGFRETWRLGPRQSLVLGTAAVVTPGTTRATIPRDLTIVNLGAKATVTPGTMTIIIPRDGSEFFTLSYVS